MDVTRERCQKIIEAGANVILCSRGIDDFALKYFVEHNCIAIRRVKKGDLKLLLTAAVVKLSCLSLTSKVRSIMMQASLVHAIKYTKSVLVIGTTLSSRA